MSHKFFFKRLDTRTRTLMTEEILSAQKSGALYYSKRFTQTGTDLWPTWLLNAAREFDEHWLAFQIDAANAMNHLEVRTKPKGGYTIAHVPHTASETFADGQFNRFYIAAICRRAIEDGQASVYIYRAKNRDTPRSDSLAIEGTTRNVITLLGDVRNKELSLKCDILRPNSGISVDY
jgi:hypothetical protein